MKKLLFTFLFLLVNYSISNSQCISNTSWEKIVPSENLPDDIKIRNANNNLDVINFQGRYYLAFRTAPSHFASKKTKLYILSSADCNTWKLEKELFLKSDLREPRFFIKDNELFFMFFKGGTKMFKFEPQGIFTCILNSENQTWSDIKEVDIPKGYVPWRIKEHKGVFYLSTYDGVNEYKLDVPAEFRLFTSTDGLNWQAISKNAQISHERAIAEVEITFDNNDDIWGIARLEYDGSYIVHAKNGDYSNFEYWYNEHKFDSPLFFNHDGKHYLIARRNLDGPLVQKKEKYNKNLVRYSLKQKTTALYLLDKYNKRLIHIKDFESTGDCAFPGIAKINSDEYYVFNYSSDIEKRKKVWIAGQLGKTFIYKSKLSIQECSTFINSNTVKLFYQYK